MLGKVNMVIESRMATFFVQSPFEKELILLHTNNDDIFQAMEVILDINIYY